MIPAFEDVALLLSAFEADVYDNIRRQNDDLEI
jgi:hypothetical protein